MTFMPTPARFWPAPVPALVAAATGSLEAPICFSDRVGGTGVIVVRREAVVGVDQEGSRVSDVLVRAGEMVTENQELARLMPPAQPGEAGPCEADEAGEVAVPEDPGGGLVAGPEAVVPLGDRVRTHLLRRRAGSVSSTRSVPQPRV